MTSGLHFMIQELGTECPMIDSPRKPRNLYRNFSGKEISRHHIHSTGRAGEPAVPLAGLNKLRLSVCLLRTKSDSLINFLVSRLTEITITHVTYFLIVNISKCRDGW
jgi:hypothetical protein